MGNYTVDYVLDKLKVFNVDTFKFDPDKHVYSNKNIEYISATTYIQRFSEQFDMEYWSNRKATELGVEVDVILKEWKDKADYANVLGTEVHDWIEYYFTKRWRELPTDQDIINRISKFIKIYSTDLYKLEPVAFEVRIFSEKWQIAGMIDALFLYKDKLFILDWKTNKIFDTQDSVKFKKKLYTPFDKYYDCEHTKYSLQVSLYSSILEQIGLRVSGGYLVHIGPDDMPAKIYTAINMQNELKSYIQ